MRMRNDWCEDRRRGKLARSATALAALLAGIRFAATWRRHTDTTSRSTSSGTTSVSPAKRSRACSPSLPSSPSATANALASTTITFCPNVIDSRLKRHAATTASGDAVENLLQSGLICVGDQTASKVFLQGLMRARRSLPQDPVGAFRNVFDL